MKTAYRLTVVALHDHVPEHDITATGPTIFAAADSCLCQMIDDDGSEWLQLRFAEALHEACKAFEGSDDNTGSGDYIDMDPAECFRLTIEEVAVESPKGWEKAETSVDPPASLINYDTAEVIRLATAEEVDASIEAAQHDGGAGVILVDGTKCYAATVVQSPISTIQDAMEGRR